MNIKKYYGLLGLCGFLSIPSYATQLEATFTSNIQNGWAKVERLASTNTNINAEAFPSDGRGNQTGQIATFFASSQPHSKRFLLHFAPNWNASSGKNPILLIHGANQDSDIAWANPNNAGDYGCGVSTCPNTGLMQALNSTGFQVFAVTFAHKNGDSFIWSQIIHEAIERVKAVTGANKVDVISWSKGAFNARMYVSSTTRWNAPYGNNIGQLIMLGGPNNGIDWSFRHGWNHTFAVYPGCGGVINGPTAHDNIVCYGIWWDGSDNWVYDAAYFPGAAQMLKPQDDLYTLPMYEQDWYTTYYGGLGYYTYGRGIDSFMADSLVDEVRQHPTPYTVDVHNLCGDNANIALIHNEHTGPSDGVVFESSCRDNVGIGTESGSNTLSINHLQLGWHSSAINQIINWLN